MDPKVLFGIVVTFVIAIFALGIGADIVREVQTSTSEKLSGGYFKNKSVTPLAPRNATVGSAHTALHESCVFTLASCRVFNSSDKDVIASTNYTITSPSDCVLNFRLKADNVSKMHNKTAKLVDCPYTALMGMTYNVTRGGQMALSDFSSWTPTLALVIMSAIIISVLVGFVVIRMR